MKYLFVLFMIFLLNACGNEHCDFYVDGACVNTGGANIDKDKIDAVFSFVEVTWNETKNDNLNLTKLARKNDLYIRYVNTIKKKNARGVYIEKKYHHPTIKVKKVDDDTDLIDQCIERYYVLGHELFHFIIFRHEHGSMAEDGHSDPSIWIEAAYKHNINLSTTAEYKIYFDVAYTCGWKP